MKLNANPHLLPTWSPSTSFKREIDGTNRPLLDGQHSLAATKAQSLRWFSLRNARAPSRIFVSATSAPLAVGGKNMKFLSVFFPRSPSDQWTTRCDAGGNGADGTGRNGSLSSGKNRLHLFIYLSVGLV